MTPAADAAHMARALQLAARGLCTAHPNPRVGCVIADDAGVCGEGWHERTGGPHAEVAALQAAGPRARGATAYVTLEPCCHTGRTPPCTAALAGAGVRRVVFAVADPNPRVAGGGRRALEAAGIAVEGGLLEAPARELNIGFFSRMERGRPWVRSKVAASIDGRTALAGGESRWISSEAARRDGHGLRARSSAILTGAGTVLADDPALTVRRDDLPPGPPPLRVVADSTLRTPPGARLFREPGPVLVATARPDPARQRALEATGGRVERLGERQVDLAALLAHLATLEVNELLVEAGPALNGALIRAGLLDELVVYVAPCVLGAGARGMFDLPDLADMAARPVFRVHDVRRVGPDLRVTWRPGG